MKKDLGIMPAVYPMPVLMVAAYDEQGRVNVMNAAWGMICGMDKIALFISEGHKTTQNILKTKAFTVSIADRDHMDVADYFGIATGNKTPDKFERTGYHAVRSNRVNAPVIDEFPVAMECELAEVVETETMYCIVGKIVNGSMPLSSTSSRTATTSLASRWAMPGMPVPYWPKQNSSRGLTTEKRHSAGNKNRWAAFLNYEHRGLPQLLPFAG